MKLKPMLLAGTIVSGTILSFALPAFAADVTFERLLNAPNEPQNWLTTHRTYDGDRFSPLDQINRDSVKGLHLVITQQLGNSSGGGRYDFGTNEATPLVDDGFMYVVDPWSVVEKLDVRDGMRAKILWKMDPTVDRTYASDAACCGIENRGVALAGNNVIATAIDGRLSAINRDTGEVVWQDKIGNLDRAEVLTIAPLVVKNLAIVGPAGGEYGIQGWLAAYDVTTGKQAWKFNIVPNGGDPGSETWAGDTWKTGGGGVWQTGTYDNDLNTLYWGTGNPAPQFDAEYRPGDNLYTDSLVALDPDTGKLRWYFQMTPNDPYDHDEIGESQLVNVVVNGQPRKVVVHAARNGFMYGLDRINGQFMYGKQYVETLNWTHGIDAKTGKPVDYDPATQVQAYVKGTAGRRGQGPGVLCPGLGGGKNWEPASYNPTKQTLYVPSSEGCAAGVTAAAQPTTVTGGAWDVRSPKGWRGRDLQPVTNVKLPSDEQRSSLVAIDPVTGANKAKILVPYRPQGSLSTAGGLNFEGDQSGVLTAYNDDTLAVVWQWNVGTSLKAPPMTYSVNGKQYIAILAGSVPSSFEKTQDPALQFYTPANDLFVFAL